MKSKKSEKANLEKQKSVLFMFGLVISLGAVLLAFEWKTKPNPVSTKYFPSSEVVEEIYTPPATKENKNNQKPKIEVQTIEILSNDEIISEPFGFVPSEIDASSFEFKEYLNILPEEIVEEETIFVVAEQMPEFPGGKQALLKYIANSIRYPAIALENGITGKKIYVSFIINEKGGIEDVNLLRGVDEALNNEALRVLNSLPNWQPGRQGGKAVKVRYTLPIVFEMR